MRVCQAEAAARHAADVRDHEQRLDRMLPEERREWRVRRSVGLEEHARNLALVECEAPAIAVRTGFPAAARESGEREDDVGRDIALHPEQLTHASTRLSPQLMCGRNAS